MFGVAAVQEAEAIVLDLTRRLTLPREKECLYCYVHRMITDHGCDTSLRWATRYRDLRAPRAKALEQRLGRMGGFCDCELFLNGVTLDRRLRVPGTAAEEGEEDATDLEWPDPLPECAGVRAGSTQRCTHWVRQRRRAT